MENTGFIMSSRTCLINDHLEGYNNLRKCKLQPLPFMMESDSNKPTIDSELQDIIYSNGGFICGGYARFLATKDTNHRGDIFHSIGDMDIYSKDHESYEKIKTCLIDIGYKTSFVTKMSYNFSSISTYDNNHMLKKIVSLIIPQEHGRYKTFGTLPEIISHFDMSVCRIGFSSPVDFICSDKFFVDSEQRVLRIEKLYGPITMMKRIHKYIGKGFYISHIELYKVLESWDNMNGVAKLSAIRELSNPELTGDKKDLLYEQMLYGDV